MKFSIQSNFQQKIIWRPSIRFYLVLMNLVLLCLLFPVSGLLFLHQEAKFRDIQLNRTITQMREALENRSGALVRNMALSAGYAVAGYDFTFLNDMVRRVVTEDTEIQYCLIMDTNSRAVAHSDPEKTGSQLTGIWDKKAALLAEEYPHNLTEEDHPQVHFSENASGRGEDDDSGPIMEALTPVYNGAKLYGVLRCGFSLKRFSAEIRTAKQDWALRTQQFKVSLALIAGILFAIGLGIALLFTRLFVRAMHIVSAGVSRVARGDLDHTINSENLVCSELLRFSESFNVMTGQLKASRRELDEYSRSLEQKVYERTRELKDAQANLLQQAHEAGMAEMAVGILHNIGNAITPAKVGLFRLSGRMGRKSLLDSLPAALEEIAGVLPSVSDLAAWQKERLLAIIKLIPAAVEEEYAFNIRELEQVQRKLSHIESIVALQMHYTKLFGTIENVDVCQVVEDALTLLGDALQKRGIKVVKDYSTVPVIKIERTNLIQVIINLIKNSYEAMEKVDVVDRVITLSIRHEQGPQEVVAISVKDNGIGFSEAEKTRLFTFGYTTKEKGSGFGLHSCANYLIARSGSLIAASDGPGRGAEFVVRLAAGRSEDPAKGEVAS